MPYLELLGENLGMKTTLRGREGFFQVAVLKPERVAIVASEQF